MKNSRTALLGFTLMVIVVVTVWIHCQRAAADETIGLAIIEDLKGDCIAVEPTSRKVWHELVELCRSKEEMWIGGVVEVFVFMRPNPNYPWGFRFKPESITVAEVTAEGLQTTIRDISEDMDYWSRLRQVYVFAKVIEIREGGKTGDITGPEGCPDGKCDIRDISAIGRAFNSSPSDPKWNPDADLNDDGKVDVKDAGIAAGNFGRSW